MIQVLWLLSFLVAESRIWRHRVIFGFSIIFWKKKVHFHSLRYLIDCSLRTFPTDERSQKQTTDIRLIDVNRSVYKQWNQNQEVLNFAKLLPPAYVVRWEGNVFTGANLSVHRGGTPVIGSFSGLWSQVLSQGGVPQSLPGVPLQLGLWYLPPAGTGVLLPLGSEERVLTTLWTVCLLLSRRRTFLFGCVTK